MTFTLLHRICYAVAFVVGVSLAWPLSLVRAVCIGVQAAWKVLD